MNRILFLLFIPMLMLSCKKESRPLTANDKRAITDTITQTLNNYYTAVRTSGLTAEFAWLDHSVDFFWVPPGYTIPISYDSVARVLTQNAPMFKLVDNRFDTLMIIPLTHELATYTAKLHSTIIDTAGNTTRMQLMETGVLIKRKDGWKLLNGQTGVLNTQ